MELLPASLDRTLPIQRRFRNSRLGACSFAAVFAGAALFWSILAFRERNPFLGALAAFVWLVALVPLTAARRSFRSDNWVLGLARDGFYVKFRSHLNRKLPPQDLAIVRIGDGEIAAVRPVRERTEERSSKGKVVRVARFLDLRLRSPWPAALDEALAAERARRVPGAGKWHDYPATLPDARTIRLRWSGVEGGVRRALRALAPRFAVEEELRLGYERPGEPTARGREDLILSLCERGDAIAAVKEARAAYGMDLAEAKAFVEELMARPVGAAR